MNLAKWDRRIRRAEELAVAHPFAAEVLHFYQRVAMLQKRTVLVFAPVFGR
jgi:hypothetical protein